MKRSAFIEKSFFGEIQNKQVYLFTLSNTSGNAISITNYGGIITSWLTHDRNGDRSNIVAGLSSLKEYERNDPYFGAIIGRYCNRIDGGRFYLEEKCYQLTVNDGRNQLHGGKYGFDKQVWRHYIPDRNQARLQLRYTSKNGEEGYPGNFYVIVEYHFTNANELIIRYYGKTDAPTPVAMTNHSYFNLTGDFSNFIGEHLLCINANSFTPVDENKIPDGSVIKVEGTAFDFTKQKKIGPWPEALENGYDHNFVLNKATKPLTKAATVKDNQSGRFLEVFTTEPGLQFYTGNYLDGSFFNERGQPLQKGSAFCLETQHFPDSPNKLQFPSCILYPGENYFSETIYKMTVSDN